MIDLFVYKCLEKINDISTKVTSWSWQKLWADRINGYGNRGRRKDRKNLKKGKKRKTQVGIRTRTPKGKVWAGWGEGGVNKETN